MTRHFLFILIALFSLDLPSVCQTPPPLDWASRISYQRAIEEVYWQQRIWPQQNPTTKPALDAVISPEQLRAKTEDALRLSNALAKYWHAPITGQQLQAEIARMSQNSKQPEVLRQIFAALDNNPRIIAEVLARPALAERLARSFYERDQRFSAQTQAFDLWWEKTASRFAAHLAEPDFSYVIPRVAQVGAQTESWTPTFGLPDGDIVMSSVWTGAEMIVWGGGSAQFNTGSRYNPATDTWTPTNASAAPDGKSQHTAVWTGTEMIVWGGCDQRFSEHQCESNDGGRYNPVTDEWVPTAIGGAPTPRIAHTAVWTGKEMIVWGGCAFFKDACHPNQVGTSGGRYNPATDIWTPTNTNNAPVERSVHTAVWAGNKMIVWGGFNDAAGALSTGGFYNPKTDTWTATAPKLDTQARYYHSALWTGSRMIIWGGANGTKVFRNGFRYNPGTNTWRPVSLTGAPAARGLHAAVWTGAEMLVWGGSNGVDTFSTGGRYDPATNTWKATSTLNAPAGRYGHPANVWTGTQMIVWGGQARTGGRYDPATDSWTPTNANEAPTAREHHSALWTGTEMIVWGGDDVGSGIVNTGGRYNLATDSWTPTSTVNVPEQREFHSALWTGTEMLIWGGQYGSTGFKTGGRYNPVTNSWTPTKTNGAPAARSAHSSVWTGTEMIVFGGSGMNTPWLNNGGRYNPSTNSWTATTTNGAPSPRELAAAVWTGSEMVIWGGGGANYDTNTGGRYNPSTNTWKPTSLINAPSARDWSAAVWTGSKMLLWGGQTYNGSYIYHNDGALYDPATDSWTPTTLDNAPIPRAWFGYAWTGADLLVWGGGCTFGGDCDRATLTGGRYNVASDSWTATTTDRAPTARSTFPAVWTGDKMIVWGGFQRNSQLARSGSVYTPAP